MPYKVYIDGQAGTTGLQLQEKLSHHDGVELLLIAEEKRKDEAERKRLMNLADVVFLCLPDAAAKEAVKLVENPNTCIIDASTALEVFSFIFPFIVQSPKYIFRKDFVLSENVFWLKG